MANTIYATFMTESDAERAAGALMDHGVSAADVSFVVPEAPMYSGAERIPTHLQSVDAAPPTPVSVYNDAPVWDLPVPGTVEPPVSVTYLTRPAEQPEGIQTGYSPSTPEPIVPEMPIPATFSTTTNAAPIPTMTKAASIPTSSNTATIPADTWIDTVEHENRPHIVDMNRQETHATSGISTTTARDAGKGAAEGAAVGIGLGILLGLAVVAIPGVGLVAGTGALIAGLAAATGAAGMVAGGVYGYLADLGVPPSHARFLSDHLEAGGPVLSINVTGDVRQDEIVQLLKKYGATSAQAF